MRVAIVGGGCAGMSAAWQLAKQPGYEIHVYEKSWRLGGKGASVRATDGRILEHGLHVWMGFYDNAFRMMRECYGEAEKAKWGPAAEAPKQRLTHGRFEDAFMAESHVGTVDPDFHGKPMMWAGFFSPNESQPGTPLDEGVNPFTLNAYVARTFDLAKTLMLSLVGGMPGEPPGEPRPDERSRTDEVLSVDFDTMPRDSTAALLKRVTEMARAGALSGAAVMLQIVTMLEVWLGQQNFGPKSPESTLALAEAAASQARKMLRDIVSVDPELRVKTEIIDIVLTVLVGLFRDRVMLRPEGLDYINDFDYREWLQLHGATKTSLESRFLRGAYDFAFAYEDGDLKRPRLAAGVALRGAFRMFFTYRGSMFWRMRSGMGDAIFAPLYAVLRRPPKRPPARKPGQKKPEGPLLKSPVRFHFLHELKKVTFDTDGRSVASLTFDTPWGDPGVADALDENGCWPPSNDHLRAGATPGNGQPLLRGTHFDAVIVATGVHEFNDAFVKSQTLNPDIQQRWAAMTKVVKTIPTKAAQVWLDKSLYDLGWRRGTGLFTSMGGAFDTYADMTHLLPAERWAGGAGANPSLRSIAYFCNPMADARVTTEMAKLPGKPTNFSKLDPADKDGIRAAVKHGVDVELEELLLSGMSHFWPNLLDKSVTPTALPVGLRFTQVNFEGSERYTLSLPGSLALRISPLDPDIDNMTVAGDWTASGLDCGCVEAAVMSGMLAVAALSDEPDVSHIVGYDHP